MEMVSEIYVSEQCKYDGTTRQFKHTKVDWIQCKKYLSKKYERSFKIMSMHFN